MRVTWNVKRVSLWAALGAACGTLGCTQKGAQRNSQVDAGAPQVASRRVPEASPVATQKVPPQDEAPAPAPVPEPAPEAPAPPPVLGRYSWAHSVNAEQTLATRVPVPQGYARVPVAVGSFAEWLRTLPVKPGKPPVYLYNGSLKGNQEAQALVLDIDTGSKDLQQCADAVMRLRAEYLYAREHFEAIHFNFTTGDRASYSQWRQGFRPRIQGSQVSWLQTGVATASYQGFRDYLESVFTYAGSASLSREMVAKDVLNLAPGDVFIRGGFPGHAVIVLDVAKRGEGEAVFLLAQSYMPAQDMHVLRNPSSDALSPWYSTEFGEELVTPEWTFTRAQLKQFR
jgi:Domain of unknown function (4846)